MRLIDADKLMLSLADWKLQEAPIHTYEKPKEFTADNMQDLYPEHRPAPTDTYPQKAEPLPTSSEDYP